MRSAGWYDAHSYCRDSRQRHGGVEVETLLGEFVGYLCPHCLERVRPVRRGSSLWIAEADA